MVAPDDSAWIPAAEQVARGVRRRVLAHIIAHGGGYMSQACSSAETLAAPPRRS